MQKDKFLREWEVARDDLGLEIVAPYEVDVGNGAKVYADILVKNFGGKSGTLVVKNYSAVKPYLEQLRKLRYGFSVLEEPREGYNREIFIEMLSEWTWAGDISKKPEWVIEIRDAE